MRADVYITQQHPEISRTRAQRLIEAGLVSIDGQVVSRCGMDVCADEPHAVVLGVDNPYVGRGGCKLEAALTAFELPITDAWAIDVGASTGGFTDCLLQHGATRVYAVDSGWGQLAQKLLDDTRVCSMERCNARYLSASDFDAAFEQHGGADVIVMDVSFISQTYILPVLPSLLRADGHIVTLIKPQFEVGKSQIGKHGLVKRADARREAVQRVLDAAAAAQLCAVGLIRSPIVGGDGNVEFLAHFRHTAEGKASNLLAQRSLSWFA